MKKTREEEDLELAKEVNWLYDKLSKKEMEILMKWVSANCDVVKEQERKRVLGIVDKTLNKNNIGTKLLIRKIKEEKW